MACKITWISFLRMFVLLLLVVAITIACFTLPAEKMLKDFLLWVEQDLGSWGPLALSVAYIPLTILAVPASILTLQILISVFRAPMHFLTSTALGGGYLFGLPIGFVADSVGSTLGAGAAFLLGRTLGRSFVISKLNEFPQFHAVAIAIQRSGFKIILLLRLAPLIPFNMLNYVLSVTPVSVADYLLASWLGMVPITLALVYAGTTLKDLSDVTHGWNSISKTRWAFIVLSLVISVLLMFWVTHVAKDALETALADNDMGNRDLNTPESASLITHPVETLHQPLTVDEGK